MLQDIIENIDGFMSAEECTVLYNLSNQLNNAIIVEIGSHKGRSSCCLAAGALNNNSKVYCIDIWENYINIDFPTEWGTETFSDPNIFIEFKNNINKYGFHDIINYIQGNSNDIGSKWEMPIDLLLIDGDHSYEGIKNDYEKWSPFMVKNGLILFHDYNSENHPDVKEYINHNYNIIQIDCIEHLLITQQRSK